MKLTRDFFDRPTLVVARELLGFKIIFKSKVGERLGRIVETEAYVGPEDKASHASKGLTKRTAPMFGPPGFTYIYLIYGVHWCLNLVTEKEGYPAAVLIRALEPINPADTHQQASGPGKVCRWLGLNGEYNQVDATNNLIYIEKGESVPDLEIIACPRIGVAYAGEWANQPWRFYIHNHPSVSEISYRSVSPSLEKRCPPRIDLRVETS